MGMAWPTPRRQSPSLASGRTWSTHPPGREGDRGSGLDHIPRCGAGRAGPPHRHPGREEDNRDRLRDHVGRAPQRATTGPGRLGSKDTGASRTACTGSATSSTTKTDPRSAPATARASRPPCARPPSACTTSPEPPASPPHYATTPDTRKDHHHDNQLEHDFDGALMDGEAFVPDRRFVHTSDVPKMMDTLRGRYSGIGFRNRAFGLMLLDAASSLLAGPGQGEEHPGMLRRGGQEAQAVQPALLLRSRTYPPRR